MSYGGREISNQIKIRKACTQMVGERRTEDIGTRTLGMMIPTNLTTHFYEKMHVVTLFSMGRRWTEITKYSHYVIAGAKR